MSQQDRDSLKWNAREQQFNRERIAEAVRVALGNLCEREESL
jgi:hypothetical protein